MRIFLSKIALLGVLCFSSINNYALPLIEADAFFTGDANAATDVSTGLTWLDFGNNNNKSYAQVVSELGTTYKDWRLPTEQEVSQLWNNLFSSVPGWNPYAEGIGYGSVYYYGNAADLQQKNYFYQLLHVFGINWVNYPPEYDPRHIEIISAGAFQKDDGYLALAGMYYLQSPNRSYMLYLEVMNSLEDPWLYEYARTEAFPYNSTLLVKKSNALAKQVSVPEPSPLSLIGLGLIAVFFYRRKNTLSVNN